MSAKRETKTDGSPDHSRQLDFDPQSFVNVGCENISFYPVRQIVNISVLPAGCTRTRPCPVSQRQHVERPSHAVLPMSLSKMYDYDMTNVQPAWWPCFRLVMRTCTVRPSSVISIDGSRFKFKACADLLPESFF